MKHVTQAIRALVLPALMITGITAGVVAMPMAVSAATPQEELCKGSGGSWSSNTCTTPGNSTTLQAFFKNIVNILIFIVGAISVIMIIVGGIRYVVSNGDQAAVTGAKNTILYAVVGIVVTVMAYAIVNFVINSIK
jgi:hypothetical protein